MDKEKTFGAKVGQLLAYVLVTCFAACVSACAIALTVRFISWMF